MGDQFTDIGVFPDLCMDSMLPPGMARAKALGLDKCEMGIELGFRSNHHHHHTTENKYNDKWIRDWTRDASVDAKGFQKSLSNLEKEQRHATDVRNELRNAFNKQISGLSDQLSGQQGNISGLRSDISGLRGDLSSQANLVTYGLEGLKKAQVGLQSLDERLVGHAGQVDEQLRRAQQGWSNQFAAAEAGWDVTKAAWDQKQADWTNQFAQQQRQIETQLVTEREEYEDQVQNIQDIYGRQSEAQRTAWEQQAAGQRAMFIDQLDAIRETDKELADEWTQKFAQSQEQQRITDAIQDRDRQASLNKLGTDFQAGLQKQREDTRSEYQTLIKAASSDAEKARAQQALKFAEMQQDQQAAWHMISSERAAQDRVFGTKIGELRRDLGIETDLLGEAQRDFAQETRLEQGRLEQSLKGLGQQSEAARQQLRQDVSGQLGGFREDITDYKASLAEQKEAQDAYYLANQRHREMQIRDAERARTAASYASPGTALNKQVKGVRRAGSSKPGGLVRSRSPRNVFNRSGLRISSLNI